MKLVVAIVGLLTSIMAFIVSFLPPDNIRGDSTDMYVELLVVSFGGTCPALYSLCCS